MLSSVDYLYKTNRKQVVHPVFSIVIPAFNEESRIIPTLLDWVNFLNLYPNMNYELLVIMDGCTDHTLDVVSDFCTNENSILPLFYPTKLGKGGAILEAFKKCRGNFVFFTDADGSLPVTEFPKFIKALKTHDFVIGSRYFDGSLFLNTLSFSRFVASRIFNALLKLLFPKLKQIRDTQCGAKLLRKEVVDVVCDELLITDFAFDVNLILSALNAGFSFRELPVQYNHVELDSKVSNELFKTGFKMFFSIVRLKLFYSWIRPILSSRFMKRFAHVFLGVFL